MNLIFITTRTKYPCRYCKARLETRSAHMVHTWTEHHAFIDGIPQHQTIHCLERLA